MGEYGAAVPDGARGYTGQYRDPVTRGYPLGNGYRFYLPGLMRFAAPDSMSPFGKGGVNPYVYCEGDPVNRTDPSGHFDFFGILGISRAVDRDVRTDMPLAKFSMTGDSSGEPAATKSIADNGGTLASMPGASAKPQGDDALFHKPSVELRTRLSDMLKSHAPRKSSRGYPAAVDFVNEKLTEHKVAISPRSAQSIMETLPMVESGETLHTLASMNEAKNFFRDLVTTPMSTKDASVTVLGVALNSAGFVYFFGQDYFDYMSRQGSRNARLSMAAYVAHNVFPDS
ncbi:hypothetical protein CAL14_14780 [Bordetella genomosp. 9]|uniref:RHS repeat-associated core domain-containing protein n=1 Tax=Bordetella genomosp. 9 TaxID=1416803 RepID=UPI000A294A99|nr:RHS repeat-associated core domain-containing protein [Bordetella genomosp. 9]ARP92752.1 hypothetical protein CAL14_14780 [Bordetella genomosp. 9]